MKISCSKAELSRLVSLAQGASSTKNVMPMLMNLYLEADSSGLTLTGTDLEIGVKVHAKVEVAQTGKATLPARKLAEVVKSLEEGEVEITVKDGTKGEIKSGRAKINLVGMPPEDFPQFPAYTREKSLSLPAKVLLDMIKRGGFSVSQDETRHILQGALLQTEGKKLRLVSTDGHRLSAMEHEWAQAMPAVSAVVPSKALAELARVLPSAEESVTLYFTDNVLYVELGELTLSTRLIDGQFPSYEQVIPKKNENVLQAEVASLAAALNRMSPLAADKGNSVKFNLKDDSLQLSAATADVGEGSETLDIEYSGSPLSVAFNARYLLDVLKVLGTERLEMRLGSPLSPALITPVGGAAASRYVVMPMRG